VGVRWADWLPIPEANELFSRGGNSNSETNYDKLERVVSLRAI
jgi:hypothetical protein